MKPDLIRNASSIYAAALLLAAGGCLWLAMAVSAPVPETAALFQTELSAPSQAGQEKPDPSAAAKSTHPPAPLRRAPLPGPLSIQLVRVVDGDTFEGRLRVWFGQEITTLVRLRNIDAPELKARCAAEAELAAEARQTLEEILRSGRIVLTGIGLDKYAGRVLADVSVMTHDQAVDDVGTLLLAGGYARPYQGGRRRGWCS